MSNLWSHELSASVARVGSFAVHDRLPSFTAWGSAAADEPDMDIAPEPAPDAEAIEAEAFAQGWEQGRQSAEQELAEERAALACMAVSLEALRPEPAEALGLLLAETVARLVREVVGQVAIDPALFQARAQAAAAMIAEETQPSRMRVHPDDLPLLAGADLPITLVGDASLSRGALLLDTGRGWIEDGPETRLERLRAELDRICGA